MQYRRLRSESVQMHSNAFISVVMRENYRLNKRDLMENLKGIIMRSYNITRNQVSVQMHSNAFISIMMRENYRHKKRYLNESLRVYEKLPTGNPHA